MLSGAISVYPEGGPQSWRATVPAISQLADREMNTSALASSRVR
jgi:hypothetical protein